ncbi:hypothetical protein [Streptomyces sp. NBC_01190]|uniref:hypothetical protein n=1 Tax=Streptomyces sp. NBC_01190 TaxID=2903767 RepID=UPI00386950D6|nr:hypothetical protein OG519_21950 [Streptomyces sp. NBC_01190]
MRDDGRVEVADALTAARLGRLLTAAGGVPVALDPIREEAALAAFRAARASVRPVIRAGRALRVAAATIVSVVALGGVAVAVTTVTGRAALPGAGSGSAPMSRPPAAVTPLDGTLQPQSPLPAAPTARATPPPCAGAGVLPTGETPCVGAELTPPVTPAASVTARPADPRRERVLGRHGHRGSGSRHGLGTRKRAAPGRNRR